MGVAYGKALESNLKAVYEILVDYYVDQQNIPLEKLAAKAELFYEKYPFSFQKFIDGVAEGAKITLEQAKILNGMETLNSLIKPKEEVAACAFISIPPSMSATNSNLLGRNYDFFPPFDRCSKYLTVAVIKENDHVPTAFIGFAGQIYCPTCVNQNGLFVELNNGMPSGGFDTDHTRESLLINLLEVLQNSASLNQLDKQLSALNSDYSLVINIANTTHTKAFEYSALHGMKSTDHTSDEVVVSTNFFTHQGWSFAIPSDEACWLGHTRRDNLIGLSASDNNITVEDLQNILDKNIENGGGSWEYTLYQLIFDTGALELRLKMPTISDTWHKISLVDPFNNEIPEVIMLGQGADQEL